MITLPRAITPDMIIAAKAITPKSFHWCIDKASEYYRDENYNDADGGYTLVTLQFKGKLKFGYKMIEDGFAIHMGRAKGIDGVNCEFIDTAKGTHGIEFQKQVLTDNSNDVITVTVTESRGNRGTYKVEVRFMSEWAPEGKTFADLNVEEKEA